MGPSSKTCPRWESARALRTSVRTMPWLVSSRSATASSAMGAAKLGQPQPEANLSCDEKSGSPDTTST